MADKIILFDPELGMIDLKDGQDIAARIQGLHRTDVKKDWVTINGNHVFINEDGSQGDSHAGSSHEGGIAADSNGKELISKNPTMDQVNKLDPALLSTAQLGRTPHEAGDPTLAKIYQKQGFNAAPQQVSQAQYDQLIQDGQPNLYRGFDGENGQSHMDQFINGATHFAGRGVNGNGSYSTTSKQNASAYSNHALLNFTLSKDANVVSEGSLESEMRATANSLGSGNAVKALLSDAGRYAALRGYDAISIKNPLEGFDPFHLVGSTYIVLNRGKVVIPK